MSDEQNPLSKREMEIVELVATGATNQQIARELVISVNTVKVHLRNVYEKLDVGSRTEATMTAVRAGWVDVPRTDDLNEEETAAEEAPAEASSPGLPDLGRWPRVAAPKRVALVVAAVLAALALFLPQVLRSWGNGQADDPFGGVFPTEAAGPSTGRWRTRAQMPTPRTDLAVAAHDGLVYAIGGVSSDGVTDRVEVYDPARDAWSTIRSKPTAAGFVSAVAINGKIYVPGGIDAKREPLDVLEVYDPVQDAWDSLTPIPKPLGAYGLAALGGRLYLFGGSDGEQYVDSVYGYDPATDQWETLQPMERAKGFVSAAALDERIYVAGGYDGVTEFRDLDSYDPAANAWTSHAAMDLRRGGLALVAVRESLYAIGGGMTNYLAFNEVYDYRVDRWRRIETPITGQWKGLGADFVYPQIYAIGGWSERPLSVNEAYQALFVVSP